MKFLNFKNKTLSAALLTTLMYSSTQASFLCSQVHMKDYLFGLEFTLTTDAIVYEGNANPKEYGLKGNPIKKLYWEKLAEALRKKCQAAGDCTSTTSSDKHGTAIKYTFSDGYYFTLGIDSAVLEVNAKPATSSGYKKVKERMQDFVFDTASSIRVSKEELLANAEIQAKIAEEGKDGNTSLLVNHYAGTPMKAHQRAGGGHIHISREAFEDSSLAFFNFAVDFQNRPELIYGALGNHLGNSAPLAIMSSTQKDAFTRFTQQFDPKRQNIDSVVRELESNVFNENVKIEPFSDWGSPQYYQAFNMTRMRNGSKATLEIRSFRPQKDSEAYLLQVQLLEAWVNKIKSRGSKIEYVRKDLPADASASFSPQQIVNSFAQLIHELGLPYETFKVLLPENLQRIKPDLNSGKLPYSL